MKALVTGATGFTGSHLALELVRRGHDVRALVRPESNVHQLRSAGVELVHGRIESAEDVCSAVGGGGVGGGGGGGVDVIFNIAAVFRTAAHPDSYYHDVNVRGVQNIVDAATRFGVGRVVHCSTIGVQGDVLEVPSDEGSPTNPGDVYQVSKLLGERVALRAMDAGLPGVVIRPSSIYGPGDLRFLKLFRSIQRGTFQMIGTGEILFHGVYIDDLVQGFLLAGERDQALGELFILAGPEYITLNQLVHLIARYVGGRPPRVRVPVWPLLAAGAACEVICRPLGLEPPLHRRRVHFFVNNRAFSIDKAQRLLGYHPEVSIEEGVARSAAWYIAQGLLRDPGFDPLEKWQEQRRVDDGHAADHGERQTAAAGAP